MGLRISPGSTVNGIEEGDTEALYPALVKELADTGLAYLHIVRARPDQPLFRELRASWPTTLIANPSLPGDGVPADGGMRQAGALLAEGADLIALGRTFLANPDLVTRLRTGAPLNPIRDAYLMYVGGETGYTDYPTLTAA